MSVSPNISFLHVILCDGWETLVLSSSVSVSGRARVEEGHAVIKSRLERFLL